MQTGITALMARLRAAALLLCLLAAAAPACLAQAVPDTSLNQPIPDSARAKFREVQALPHANREVDYQPQPFQPNPKKAGLYSAILPGMGQLYNRQYWKVGLVYAGVATSVYFLIDNNNQYRQYRKAYIGRIINPYNPTDPYVGIWSTSDLQQLQDGYKRYLDMTMLITGVGYALQILDAVVAAHLRNFDISEDISLRFKPVTHPGGMGVGLVLAFR